MEHTSSMRKIIGFIAAPVACALALIAYLTFTGEIDSIEDLEYHIIILGILIISYAFTALSGLAVLKGFPDAITAVFSETSVQTCIIHMIRGSLRCGLERAQGCGR